MKSYLTGEDMDKDWLQEYSLNQTVAQSFKVKSLLFHEKSKYQDIKVIDTYALGKILLLDDTAMISDKDEFIYHEVMAHIPLMVQEKSKKVLVIGAGDGGVIRELTRYKTIEEITLVEIDEMVTTTSKEFFPQVACGLNDKRVSIQFRDALEYIDEIIFNNDEKFDLIISDSTDPIGIAEGLYKSEFYKKVNSLLSDEGVFMCQTETPFYDEFNIAGLYKDLRDNFPLVQPVCAPILIYPGVYWTFAFCSKKWSATDIKPHKLEELSYFSKDLKWYNEAWHRCAFQLPNFVKDKLGY